MPGPIPFADFAPPVSNSDPSRARIRRAYRLSEGKCLEPLLQSASLSPDMAAAVERTARDLVLALRRKQGGSGVEGLMREYALSSQEGVALMCLAEALLRIPDAATRDALIRDKLRDGNWSAHLGGGRSLFVNAATWGLVVTGKLVGSVDEDGLKSALTRLVARAGEPVIRGGLDLAMRMLGEQFVTGETIEEALDRARRMEAMGFRYSYDMLGEAAATAEDAARYLADYEHAIHAIGRASAGRGVLAGPGISIKLSALHPRYVRSQAARVMDELLPRVKALALLARSYDIGLNIDAEEQDRLDLSLDLLERLALDPDLSDWQGLGFVVQAYGKRCPFVVDWIIDLARRAGRRMMIRLVKGAYWDAEIKRAQVDGLSDFPVYTRKVHTDVAYIACARRLLDARDAVFPQFATHNAQSLATILHLAGLDADRDDYEFQCLHGMGEPLYEEVVGANRLNRPCRIYAPVGTHETLLAYLVRRLLENGANSSFVHRIADPTIAIEELVADPVALVRASDHPGAPHDRISLPADILGARRNSAGLDLSDENLLTDLTDRLRDSARIDWQAGPSVVGLQAERRARPVFNPADLTDRVGMVAHALERDVRLAAQTAAGASAAWAATPVEDRAACLERAADALQARMPILLGLIMREAGKSAANAIAEVREAVDFLRYYAQQARETLGTDQRPLGPAICISPWNFPLAIFTGQVAAALVAGNVVLAKPAEETPLIAMEAVRILHAAGIPADVLQCLPGEGDIGAALVAAPEAAAVLFTGSTQVARHIQAQLAERLSPDGRPIPFIAETGGLNAMIVDSSALAEQVVADVIASAFDSAGQRCSALRILCLQEEIADRTIAMLKGALRELILGNTDRLAVDIGPVITAEAKATIDGHVAAMRAAGRKVEQQAMPPGSASGFFVPPTIVELPDVADLEREIFGPVLHVVRYRRGALDRLIAQINAGGYGLTFGLHTRLDAMMDRVTRQVSAGNIYINRNVIGAVVGVQPFGGRGLSGTGPKAGGPLYLGRLVQVPPAFPSAQDHGSDPALLALIDWLAERGEGDSADRLRDMAERTPVGIRLDLPGPVGERNLYELHPKGCILLKPVTAQGLYRQLGAALATGNRVIVDGMAVPDDLPPAVRARIADRDAEPVSAVLAEQQGEALIALLREAAASPGPITPVHVEGEQGYPLNFLVEEVSVSINTTAAGGNASLMTLG